MTLLIAAILFINNPPRTERIFVRRAHYTYNTVNTPIVTDSKQNIWSVVDENAGRPWFVQNLVYTDGRWVATRLGLLWGDTRGKLGSIEIMPHGHRELRNGWLWTVVKTREGYYFWKISR